MVGDFKLFLALWLVVYKWYLDFIQKNAVISSSYQSTNNSSYTHWHT